MHMKNLKRLMPVLAVCLAVSLAKLFAGSHYDSVQASSWSDPNPGARQGSITAPAGAEVNWEAYASASGSAWSYATVSSSGIFGFSASAQSNGTTSDGGYDFFPPGGGTVYYYLYAQAQGGWEYWSSSSSGAMIVAGW
jgi:hypothetical protein